MIDLSLWRHAWARPGGSGPARAAAQKLERLRRLTRAAGTAALDLLYPPTCMACSAATEQADGLCPACWAAIAFIEQPFCDRLGTPFDQDLGPGLLSPEALADPPVFGRARAVARFDHGPAQALVHRLKYGDRPETAAVLGRWMARAGHDILDDADVIVPVPLHRTRLWRRRYNQAALLAQTIARVRGKTLDTRSLIRAKATLSQVGMSRTERAANIQGAFRLLPEAAVAFDGACVVLVDDVLTSGATLNAAARVLLRGGAARVDVLVFARVVAGG